MSILNSARGINSILEKLPQNLQESRVTEGTKYKQNRFVHYPPVSFFVKFVNYHAVMRTDQSFSLQSSSAAPLKSERILDNQWKTMFPISANKTEVEAFRSPDGKMSGIDPDKHRMIYKKTITLEKCRGFRMKTMDERKSFLKEHFMLQMLHVYKP